MNNNDIIRLNANSTVHGAMLLSLFEAHPHKEQVLDLFLKKATLIGDLAIARNNIPDEGIAEQRQAFQDFGKALQALLPILDPK